MEVRILGPVRLANRRHTFQIGSFKQRTLLASLACGNDAVISVDQLMDALWQGAPPASAAKNLQVYVWHLRKVLSRCGSDAADRLEHVPPGYRLALRPGELDLETFEHRATAAREQRDRGRLRRALASYRDALGVWQGKALADVVSVPALYAEAVNLEERRLSVTKEYLDIALALGEYNDVIGASDVPIRSNPFHEGLWMNRILALYLSGRQSDALAAYSELRHRLSADLGLEPTSTLQEVQQLILSGAPLPEGALLARLQ